MALVEVYFSLGSHGPEGIQYIPPVMKQLRSFYGKKGTDNVIWIEDASCANAVYQAIRDLRADGLSIADTIITAPLLVRYGLASEQRDRLQGSVDRVKRLYLGLEPPVDAESERRVRESTFGVRFDNALDELEAEGYPLELVVEHRDQAEVGGARNLERQANRMFKSSIGLVLNSRALNAISPYRQYLMLGCDYHKIRNRPYISDISERVSSALQRRRKTRIAVRVGSLHDAIPFFISQFFQGIPESELKITLDYDSGQPIRYPEDSLAYRLETEPYFYPSDEQIIQAIAAEVLKANRPGSMKFFDKLTLEFVNRVLLTSTTQQLLRLLYLLPAEQEFAVWKLVAEKLGS